MFIKGENEKRNGGSSPDFQPPFDEFLKESVNATFKRSEENHPIDTTG
jgi:hypothetical protein